MEDLKKRVLLAEERLAINPIPDRDVSSFQEIVLRAMDVVSEQVAIEQVKVGGPYMSSVQAKAQNERYYDLVHLLGDLKELKAAIEEEGWA